MLAEMGYTEDSYKLLCFLFVTTGIQDGSSIIMPIFFVILFIEKY